MRTALSRLLRAHGFEVVSFSAGADFLHEQDTGAYDCVVLDLHMPGLSGFDLLAQAGLRPMQPPFVVITGHDEPGNAARAQALGAADYLLKPVDRVTLISAIDRATLVSPS